MDSLQLKSLIDDIHHLDENRRHRAVLRLGSLSPGDAADATPLLEGLVSSDKDIAFWCMCGLTQLNNPETYEAIIRCALDHEMNKVRMLAFGMMSKKAPEDIRVRRAILSALRDDSSTLRKEGMRAVLEVEVWSREEWDEILKSGAADQSNEWKYVMELFGRRG